MIGYVFTWYDFGGVLIWRRLAETSWFCFQKVGKYTEDKKYKIIYKKRVFCVEMRCPRILSWQLEGTTYENILL